MSAVAMDDEERDEQAFIFVSAIKWVQRGVAKTQPDKVAIHRQISFQH